jgi:O-antigen biosynthesis protein
VTEGRRRTMSERRRRVALLMTSPLFDDQWYASLVGRPLTRRQAVRHYLSPQRPPGSSPHPLFDPAHFAAARPAKVEGDDPLVAYLQGRLFRAPTHPLFEVRRYVAEHPSSLEHPGGPVAHYCEVGAAAGLRPNGWYVPAPDEPRGLVDWLVERRDEWLAREADQAPDRVPWERLVEQEQVTGLTSVVIATSGDWRAATRAVRSVAQEAEASHDDVEVLVVDTGGDLTTAAVLASMPHRFRGARLIAGAEQDFAVRSSSALAHVRGEVVAFLHDDTEVRPGWLEPLRGALRDPAVLGAQPLLVDSSGSIRSAGAAFPDPDGLPHPLLDTFPVEDAAGVQHAQLSALTGAALAFRFHDVVGVGGFDPLVGDELGDVDLCLRLANASQGGFRVLPGSAVVHHAPDREASSEQSLAGRQVFLDRWRGRLPADAASLWESQGYQVVRYEVRGTGSSDETLEAREPVLARWRPALQVDEPAPRLRWALKNPAPAGEAGEMWGDTHFARRLAEALRSLGQDVVIDHRSAFHRPSGRLDDVVLLLRGLTDYEPSPGQVNLMWLISHPELVTRRELEAFDQVFAASVSWSAEMSREWGLRIEPLLQATEPALFHPDLAEPDTGDRVLFVGGSRRQVRPIVRDAIEAGLPLAVYGNQWEGLIPQHYVRARYLANEELGAAYRSAGVVLNDHWEDMRLSGFLSNRLFDAVGAGARVITDDVTGLRDVFGSAVQVARDVDELRELASAPDLDAVFGPDEERRRQAAIIHAEHSFEARARTLVEYAARLWHDRVGAKKY